MTLAMQAKLLRALPERVVTPAGGRPVPTDVRVIATTHRDMPNHATRGLRRRVTRALIQRGRGSQARVADGSDQDRIGAWPEKFISDTRLGPNRNGRHW